MTTHVFVVDSNTFKYHLEYMFAGTGAGQKKSSFLTNSSVSCNWKTEQMLVGMIADISRIRIGDKVIFYLQAKGVKQGTFFGVFKVASLPFFDENDQNNYLVNQTGKGLSFRILIVPDQVYAKGLTEHEFLDSLQGKNHPCDMCWSLIYRKLKANRGCTMITDYEFNDFLQKVRAKNNNTSLINNHFTFDSVNNEICTTAVTQPYQGRRNTLNILPRLLNKAHNSNAFEAHLQAYLTQNLDNAILSPLLIPYPGQSCWIGNEVSCGVGMQRIDLMIKQETDTEVVIRLIELKYTSPYLDIATKQLPWYLEWLSYYVIPKYAGKSIRVIPTIMANGGLTNQLLSSYQAFNYAIQNVTVEPLQYIGFNVTTNNINFTRYL